MPGFLILGLVILNLAFSPCSAVAFTVKEGATIIQKDVHSNAPATAAPGKTSSSPSVHRKVVNVVVDRIEEGAVYSRDGQKFQITSGTKVIDNSHSVTKMRTAELAFENGNLVRVTLK